MYNCNAQFLISTAVLVSVGVVSIICALAVFFYLKKRRNFYREIDTSEFDILMLDDVILGYEIGNGSHSSVHWGEW
jgi:hypothetical protein